MSEEEYLRGQVEFFSRQFSRQEERHKEEMLEFQQELEREKTKLEDDKKIFRDIADLERAIDKDDQPGLVTGIFVGAVGMFFFFVWALDFSVFPLWSTGPFLLGFIALAYAYRWNHMQVRKARDDRRALLKETLRKVGR